MTSKNVNIQYKELLFDILENGYEYTDPKRNVKCKQIDDAHIRIDLREGFPAINLKKLWWRGVVGELLWFLSGNTSIKSLLDNGINIWNKDAYNYFIKQADEEVEYLPDANTLEKYITTVKNNKNNLAYNGDLGRIYGAQWRTWSAPYGEDLSIELDNGEKDYLYRKDYIDQISDLITNLKEQPMSRRHIVTAWNPAELYDMALPPCHWSFEIIVRPLSLSDKILMLEEQGATWNVPVKNWNKIFKKWNIPEYGFTLKWHQRSVDTYLGLPFNIASYALLAHIIGKLTNMVPMNLIGDLSNVHLYENSWQAARELLKRDPMKYKLPQLKDFGGFKMDMYSNIDKWLASKSISDFKLDNYQSYDNIPVEMLAPNG